MILSVYDAGYGLWVLERREKRESKAHRALIHVLSLWLAVIRLSILLLFQFLNVVIGSNAFIFTFGTRIYRMLMFGVRQCTSVYVGAASFANVFETYFRLDAKVFIKRR